MKIKRYTIRLTQRVLLKKNIIIIEIFDGYAKLTYQNEKIAKQSFEAMLKSRPKVELTGCTLIDYYPKMNAREIYDLFIQDIEKAMANNKKGVMNVKYEIL